MGYTYTSSYCLCVALCLFVQWSGYFLFVYLFLIAYAVICMYTKYKSLTLFQFFCRFLCAVDSLMVRLEACLSDIKDWMRKHFLKLNDSKSEFALFGSLQQRRKVVIPNLMVG